MRRVVNKFSGKRILLYLLGLIPVTWIGLKCAPYVVDNGLTGILINADDIVNNPFIILLVEDSFRVVLSFYMFYVIALMVYLSYDRNYRHREEHGSAKWGDVATLNNRIRDKDPQHNKVLTQHVSIGFNGRVHHHNLNVMVVGGSGAGKTRYYVKPNILSMTRESNVSLVVLDSKGDTIRSTGKYLESQGYDVRVLDLIRLERSHCYNPFVYLNNDDDIQRLVTNLIKNTTPKGSQTQDPFWDQAASMLLKALMFYLYYEAPPEEQNFPMVMEMIRAGNVKENDDDYESPLDILFEELGQKNPNHIALKFYRSYHSGAAQTLKSIQISLVARLEKFNLSSLASMTQTDELRLNELGKKPGVIFALIPDNDTSYNFIIGMLYTQLFQQLFRCADFEYDGRLPVHVHFIMDEFANVCLPDDFEHLLNTMRSREVSVSIILQNMSQLKALFEKNWESIRANCDEYLYLGGNEQSTHEYISKCLGKETIDVISDSQSKGHSGGSTKSHQVQERDLMTSDEVARLDKKHCILMIDSEDPVVDMKYELMKHPNVRFSTDGGGEPYIHGEDRKSVACVGIVGDDPELREQAVDIEDLIGEESIDMEVIVSEEL